ncbi:NADP-dependent oxidoreductase domain-containing protein [Trichoderma barbatum]
MGRQSVSAMNIVFGAMTFGKPGVEMARITSLDECAKVLDVFQEFGHEEIDTALIYGQGSSEEYLGQLNWQQRGLVMDTKLAPKMPLHSYGHGPQELRQGLFHSLKSLRADKIHLFYLQGPERDTPYEETLQEINELHKEGYFSHFGISNLPAWEVAQICEICLKNGWKMPDAYQGLYNLLHRSVEPELFPCLRKYGISFYAYNPLGGGLLTDRYGHKDEKADSGGRFDPTSWHGAAYRDRYWNDTYFKALDVIRPITTRMGLTMAETALRWAVHHSYLRKDLGDSILVGASNAEQLRCNLVDLDKGPLPDDILQVLDDAWKIAQPNSTPYFR